MRYETFKLSYKHIEHGREVETICRYEAVISADNRLLNVFNSFGNSVEKKSHCFLSIQALLNLN